MLITSVQIDPAVKRNCAGIVFRRFVSLRNSHFLAFALITAVAAAFSAPFISVKAAFAAIVTAGFRSADGAYYNAAVRLASGGLACSAGNGLNGGMNDSALIGVHRFKGNGALALYRLNSHLSCVCAKACFALASVIVNVKHNAHIAAFASVRHKRSQVLHCVKVVAAAATTAPMSAPES